MDRSTDGATSDAAGAATALSIGSATRIIEGAWAKYALAVTIFAASRIVILIAVSLSSALLPLNLHATDWNDGSGIFHYLLRWDSGWYLEIMRGGYRYLPDTLAKQNVAFFPLYPLVSWCVANAFGIAYSTAALVVANLCAAASVLLLYKYARDKYGTKIAFYAVAILSFFPASLFLSAGYAESLALMLTLAAFLELERGRHLKAAIWCGLLTAARPTGVVMLLPIAWCAWPRERWTRSSLARLMATLGIAGSGLAAYMVYLGFTFHAPLAFMTSQAGWTHGAHCSLLTGVYSFKYFAELFRMIPVPYALDPWIFASFAVVIFAARSRLSTPELLFAAASFAFLIATCLCSGRGFLTMSRELLTVFPAYLAGATLLANRPRSLFALHLCMAVGLFWYSTLFAQWYWVD